MRSRNANHRRLQLALIVAVAAVLVIILLDRAERLAAEAERIAVDLQLQSLNHLATLRYATLLAQGGVQGVADMEGANPMLWDELIRPDPLAAGFARTQGGPTGYLGERSVSAATDLPRGSWAFDPARGLLFYRFRFRSNPEGGVESSALVAYRARPIFDDSDADGHFDADREQLLGAEVVRVALP